MCFDMENKKECKHKWEYNPYSHSGKVVKNCLECKKSDVYVCDIVDYCNIIENSIKKEKDRIVSDLKEKIKTELQDKIIKVFNDY